MTVTCKHCKELSHGSFEKNKNNDNNVVYVIPMTLHFVQRMKIYNMYWIIVVRVKSEEFGLCINVKKNKSMVFSKAENKPRICLKLDGHTLHKSVSTST